MLSGTPRIAGGSSGGGGDISGTVDTNEVAYGSALDTLTSDSGFIRQAGTLFQATATTATNSYPTQTATGKLDFGLGLFDATGHSMNDGDDYVFNTVADGASLGATGLAVFNGYVNNTTGEQAAVLFSSDGSLFGQSGPTLRMNATDGSTYAPDITLASFGIQLLHTDDSTFNNNIIISSTDTKFGGPTSATGAQIFKFQDGVGNNRLQINDRGVVTVNSAYTIPNIIGTVGDVLTYSAAGEATWETPSSGTPDLYVENATIAFDSTATGDNGVTIGGTGHLNAGTRSIIAGGRDNEIATAVNNAFIGGGENNTINANRGFIAGGFGNTTNGNQAFAQGTNSIADGGESSAFGTGNTSESFSEMAVGLFGTTYTPSSTGTFDAGDRVFNVGNGTAAGSRSDAFTVLKNGQVGIGIDNFEVNNATAMLEVLSPEKAMWVQHLETEVDDTTDNPTEYTAQGSVLTTSGAGGSTMANVVTPTDTTVTIEATVVARRTGGTAGTAGDGASYKIIGTFKNIGGTVTQIGTTTVVHSVEDQGGWDVEFSISGSNVSLVATGATDNDISWHSTYRVYQISS